MEELGAEPSGDGAYLAPGATARKIAEYLGFATAPIVVCNACISAVTAQILADRLIGAGKYDFAVVCGADKASTFTLAGFLSFKSLSSVPCRPFDIDRLGLNIGEAAATIIFSKADGKGWTLAAGSLDNDAHHISAPSPDGDGVRRVVETVLEGFDAAALGCISAHGTATMFNDQMESKAIEAAGLSSVPVSALKGFYGHTLGAAGALETILTMRALDEGWIIPVRGFEEIGVSGKMAICKDWTRTDKTSFLKIISGFGGCNGAAPDDKVGCRRSRE